jgi:uncharacterized protein (TIGR02001 family)
MRRAILRAAAALAVAVPAAIGPAVAPAAAGEAPPLPFGIDLAFGADFTTDYVFRGLSLSDNTPAVQPWIELSRDGFYAGVWSSNADFGTFEIEVDLYAGYRGEIDKFSYDIGYTRFIFTESADSGEAHLKLNYAVTDEVGVGTEYYYDFDLEASYLEVHASWALPFWELELSGGFGKVLEASTVDWNVGLSRGLTDTTSVDLRYHDTNIDDAIVTLTFSIETDWTTLFGNR